MLEVDIRHRRDAQELAYAFGTEAPVTGVFGRSGAGKSTLLHLVAGLLRPTAGVIRLGDETLFDRDRRVNLPAHRRHVGVAFQDHRLFPHLSVERNLRYGEQGEGATPVGFRDAVDLLELGPLLKRRTHDLSGGERQRVAIGRALLSSPRLLLLDEPLSSVDRAHRAQILAFIRRIRDAFEIPMLYVSHDLTELLQLTERLLIVDGGRTVGHGPLREVVRETTAWRAVRDLGPLNVLRAGVTGHDETAGLTTLRLAGDGEAAPDAAATTLVAPLADLAPPTTVHVAVRPEDVALALAAVDGISIRNQLRGHVTNVTTHPDRALAEVDLGLASVLVEVSHRTVAQMNLAPGREVWCLIKSNAVQYVD